MTATLDRWWWAIILAVIIGSAMITLTALEFIIGPTRIGKERALCDRAVEALLNSNDLVEVTRAGIIIRRLDCRIGRRIP